jgi:adenylate kinase
LIGPSGAGKGTHAGELCTRYRLQCVSTGDLLRQNLEGRTALGILARKHMQRAELVPDEVVDAMVEECVGKLNPDRGTLFDGFPRTAYQARFLDDLLAQHNRAVDAVLYLRVSDSEIVRRLSGRLTCRRCQTPWHATMKSPRRARVCDRCGGPLYERPDDSAALVGPRLRMFHRVTGQLLDHYTGMHRLVVVSGEGSVDEVGARIVETLEAVRTRSCRFATRRELEAISPFRVAGMLPERFVQPSLDLVLLGGPGSGKGTQAELLSAKLELPHVATGDLFRENLQKCTDLGKLAQTYMERGELVPDDVTEAMVEQRLGRPDTHAGFILDGFPRTLPQADALMEMMVGLRRRLTGVLYIGVSDDAIMKRLCGRLICRSCQTPYHEQFRPPVKRGICDRCGAVLYQRDDDNAATVRARLKTFHGQTEPLIGYYERTGLLHEIDGEGEVHQIGERSLAIARDLVRRMKIPPA